MTAMLKARNENGIEGKNYCKIRNVLFTCCEYVRPVSFRSQSVATLNDLPCLAQPPRDKHMKKEKSILCTSVDD